MARLTVFDHIFTAQSVRRTAWALEEKEGRPSPIKEPALSSEDSRPRAGRQGSGKGARENLAWLVRSGSVTEPDTRLVFRSLYASAVMGFRTDLSSDERLQIAGWARQVLDKAQGKDSKSPEADGASQALLSLALDGVLPDSKGDLDLIMATYESPAADLPTRQARERLLHTTLLRIVEEPESSAELLDTVVDRLLKSDKGVFHALVAPVLRHPACTLPVANRLLDVMESPQMGHHLPLAIMGAALSAPLVTANEIAFGRVVATWKRLNQSNAFHQASGLNQESFVHAWHLPLRTPEMRTEILAPEISWEVMRDGPHWSDPKDVEILWAQLAPESPVAMARMRSQLEVIVDNVLEFGNENSAHVGSAYRGSLLEILRLASCYNVPNWARGLRQAERDYAVVQAEVREWLERLVALPWFVDGDVLDRLSHSSDGQVRVWAITTLAGMEHEAVDTKPLVARAGTSHPGR